MPDIHECSGCGEQVYMDNAEQCIVCGDWFCYACDYENGENLWSEENSNSYYICKECLENGLEDINDENMDDAIFTKEEYNKAIKELNKRKTRQMQYE